MNNYPSILTILGTKDGLFRLSRGAETYFHSVENRKICDNKTFPVVAFEGMSSTSFIDSTMIPKDMQERDLKPEVNETAGHNMTASAMTNFINALLGNETANKTIEGMVNDTGVILKPLIDAMWLEKNYHLKSPCNDITLVNANEADCFQGSQWSEKAQEMMAGNLTHFNATIVAQDNFHDKYPKQPEDEQYYPELNNTCSGNETAASPCVLKAITVTENAMYVFDQWILHPTEEEPNAAYEMKVKMRSRQFIQRAAGNKTADFHENDEVGDHCAQINNASL